MENTINNISDLKNMLCAFENIHGNMKMYIRDVDCKEDNYISQFSIL